MRLRVAAGILWMALAAVALGDDTDASVRSPTDIPAQGLAPALQELAKDRHLQITYVPEEIGARRTPGAVGELNVEEALERLLVGTGLTFEYLDDKSITIVPVTSDLPEESEAAPVSPPSPNPAPVPQVTIEAERQKLRQQITHFVRTVTTQVSASESLARWGVKVCPGVSGLTAAQGEFILQRVSSIARTAGIPLGAKDCKPNLWIMVTADPPRLIKQLRTRAPDGFTELSGQPATASEVRRFMDSPRPIRAWYGVDLIGAMGNELGTYADMPKQDRAPKVNTLPTMSRIRIDDLQRIRSALVVVDKGRVAGLKVGALADYVALLGLAQVSLEGDYSNVDSILNLFTASGKGPPVDHLSAWDAGFLKALYATDQSSTFHVNTIVEKMVSDPETVPVAPGAAPP